MPHRQIVPIRSENGLNSDLAFTSMIQSALEVSCRHRANQYNLTSDRNQNATNVKNRNRVHVKCYGYMRWRGDDPDEYMRSLLPRKKKTETTKENKSDLRRGLIEFHDTIESPKHETEAKRTRSISVKKFKHSSNNDKHPYPKYSNSAGNKLENDDYKDEKRMKKEPFDIVRTSSKSTRGIKKPNSDTNVKNEVKNANGTHISQTIEETKLIEVTSNDNSEKEIKENNIEPKNSRRSVGDDPKEVKFEDTEAKAAFVDISDANNEDNEPIQPDFEKIEEKEDNVVNVLTEEIIDKTNESIKERQQFSVYVQNLLQEKESIHAKIKSWIKLATEQDLGPVINPPLDPPLPPNTKRINLTSSSDFFSAIKPHEDTNTDVIIYDGYHDPATSTVQEHENNNITGISRNSCNYEMQQIVQNVQTPSKCSSKCRPKIKPRTKFLHRTVTVSKEDSDELNSCKNYLDTTGVNINHCHSEDAVVMVEYEDSIIEVKSPRTKKRNSILRLISKIKRQDKI